MTQRRNLWEEFEEICARYGDNTALRLKEEEGYRSFSYRELWQSSRAFAAFLRTRRVAEEECVSVLCANRPEWAICFFGSIAGGAALVPLDEKLKEKELAYILNDCRSRILVVDGSNAPRVHELRQLCPRLETVVCLRCNADGATGGMVEFDALMQAGPPGFSGPVHIPDERVGLIVYTSGTMGYQKGVQLMLSNLSFQLHALQVVLQNDTTEHFLSLLPLSHILEITGGLLVPLFRGYTVTYVSSLKPTELVREIKESRITMIVVVPLILRLFHNGVMRTVEKLPRPARAVFRWLLRFSRRSGVLGRRLGPAVFHNVKAQMGASLRCFICGGAPLDPELARDFELFGFSVLEGYGLSETSPVIAVNTFRERKIGSVGKPLAGIDVRIAAAADGGREGEIITRGPHVMKGYLHNPDATREVIHGGWLHTGDVGFFDHKGYLHVSGRLKNVVVTGEGKKIFPEEIEREIMKSPFVKDVCVFGEAVTSGRKKGTEQVNAIIVPDLEYFLARAQKTDPREIESLIRKEAREISRHLADYKRIDRLKIWAEELPKTTTKKIKRSEAMDLFEKI